MRIAIVDDHMAFLDYSKSLLAGHQGVKLVGTALDGEEALERFPSLNPDVAIIDIAMPLINGFSLTLKLKRLMPEIGIVLVSDVDDKNYEILAEDLGALAFIHKQAFSLETLFKIVGFEA
ncbi:MAG: response regulator transcription factor [Deinococcales bacterium]